MPVLRTSTKLLVTVVLMSALAPNPAASASTFEMTVSGNDAARYKATCQVETDGGTNTVAFSGKPPVEESFEGRSLSCRITQTAEGGWLDIELRSSNGNGSSMTTAGAGSVINLSIQ